LDYHLKGPQVEPTASLWLDDVTHIRVPSLGAITNFSERTPTGPKDRLAVDFAADFPFDPANPQTGKLTQQLKVLLALQAERPNAPYPSDETFGDLTVTPLSRFLHLQPVPFGAIVDIGERTQTKIQNVLEQHLRIIPGPQDPDDICKAVDPTPSRRRGVPPVINEGRELARMFESETPGLYHRHALNWLLYNRPDVSPPRHARIWMALDATIYAALNAAWHYKWLRAPYSRLLRPYEFDQQQTPPRLKVLFDRAVNKCGEDPGAPRTCPEESPGTPRHPSWPSGHSTFSAAASHILEYFFSPDTLDTPDDELFAAVPSGRTDITNQKWIAAELRRLANNIGHARLWAGVHWLDDHIAGQKIGRSAAQAVIEQLERDCVPDFKLPNCPMMKDEEPPSDAKIQADAMRGGACVKDHDEIEQPPERGAGFVQTFGVF
jgi:membrane-associated phospholipid phosphatase